MKPISTAAVLKQTSPTTALEPNSVFLKYASLAQLMKMETTIADQTLKTPFTAMTQQEMLWKELATQLLAPLAPTVKSIMRTATRTVNAVMPLDALLIPLFAEAKEPTSMEPVTLPMTYAWSALLP
jgi:ABC-type uncharacterized transport system permease subunit